MLAMKDAPELDCTASSSSLLISSLELSVTKAYEPEIRALFGTASQFYEVAVLKSRTGEYCMPFHLLREEGTT